MKKVISFIIMFVLIIIMPGCSQNTQSTNDVTTNQEPIVQLKSESYLIKESNDFLLRETFDKNKANYFKKYYPDAKQDIISKSKDEILDIFGNPTVVINLIDSTNKLTTPLSELSNKSVCIYRVGGEDSTSIYFFIKDKRVIDYWIDEFNGVSALSYNDITYLFKKF